MRAGGHYHYSLSSCTSFRCRIKAQVSPTPQIEHARVLWSTIHMANSHGIEGIEGFPYAVVPGTAASHHWSANKHVCYSVRKGQRSNSLLDIVVALRRQINIGCGRVMRNKQSYYSGLSTADCSDLAKRVRSGKVIVYTGTIAKATTCGREQ
jgi:hypothetical protein